MNHKYLLLTVALTHTVSQAKIDQEKAAQYDSWLNTLGQVINIFEARYYQKIVPKDAMVRVIEAFAGENDPHSQYLKPEACKQLQEKMSGEFFGIGIVLPGDKKKEEEFFPVIETVLGGPAEKAGIKAGDKIIQINDEPVKGLDIDEIMSKLKGEKNTQVVLKVLRAQYPEPLSFDVIRDIVKDEMALAYYFPEYKIHYVLLAIFSEKSAQNIESIINQAIQGKSNGIIIDLRNNTGGLFDSAIDIAGLFLPKGTPVVSIKERNGKTVGQWSTQRKPLALSHNMPIIILVNNYTASASEILAGVLQVYALKKNLVSVFVVGDETFGKGSVQEVIPISNESAVKLTTGLYYLPYDICIQGKGVTPDFKFEFLTRPSETVKWVTSTYGKEKSLRKTIDPHKKETPIATQNTPEVKIEKTWKEKRKEMVAQDYYIQNAINLIELFHLGKKAFGEKLNTHEKMLSFLKQHYTIDTTLEAQEIQL